jgi:hypothetical protein
LAAVTHFRRGIGALCTAVVWAILVGSTSVTAHTGGEPLIHVPLTDVGPGSTFPVIVGDLGAGETVTFELVTDATVVTLGDVPGSPDGHFETTLVLPDSTPNGYVQLRARIPDGTVAVTWIHVVTGAAQASAAGEDSFEFVPFAAAGLALLALAFLFVRTRDSRDSPAPR